MNQRSALLLATALTVCVLVFGAGVVAAFAGRRAANSDAAPAPVSAPVTLPDNASVQDLEQLLQQREAQYRAEIEQANTQLRQAYETVQTLQTQNQELQGREVVYQQRLEEAIQYIQFIQNQTLQFGGRPSAFADDDDEHHD